MSIAVTWSLLNLPETESIQSFVSDLTGQMGQETTVPPETEAIDQDLA